MLRNLLLFVLLAVLTFGITTPITFAQENIATVHGTIYELWTFEPLENVTIKAYSDSTLRQQIFSTDGTYSLSLNPGSYTIIANYYKGTILLYDTEENITLREKENVTLDLIMFPNFDENELPENYEIPEIPVVGAGISTVWLAAVLVVAIVGTASFYYLKVLRKKKLVSEKKPEGPAVKIVGLPDDLKEVMDMIWTSGGRINQVELRRKLPYSEAKVSLMISDLEDRGLVRKIKKGRGNIIVIKK
jgi:uncharacterized membrane protein